MKKLFNKFAICLLIICLLDFVAFAEISDNDHIIIPSQQVFDSSDKPFYGLAEECLINLVKEVNSFSRPELENEYEKVEKLPTTSFEERTSRESFAEDILMKYVEKCAKKRANFASLGTKIGLMGTIFAGEPANAVFAYMGILSAIGYLKSFPENKYGEYLKEKNNFIKASKLQKQAAIGNIYIVMPKVEINETK